MRREHVELPLPGHTEALSLIAYGHYGRPVLVFPTEAGRAWDFEDNGMVSAVHELVDDGRVKLYCVDSLDAYSWSDQTVGIEERARRHGLYTQWLLQRVIPWIKGDSGDDAKLLALGCSLGAYHAVHLALQRPDLVPVALGLSGTYDVSTWRAWGDRGDAVYFANPLDYVGNLEGEHLLWLRSQVCLVLVCGQGAWETHPTGALPSTRLLAHLLEAKGLRCELDLWATDVSHDWPWWRRQLSHHLQRLC